MVSCFTSKCGRLFTRVKIQLKSEITLPYSTTSVIKYLFGTIKTHYCTATRMPNRAEIVNYLQSEIKVMSRCLSAPDATPLHHCLKNKQLKLIWFQW